MGRHRNDDELVQILDGAAMLTIMTDAGPQSFEMTAGMRAVPRPRYQGSFAGSCSSMRSVISSAGSMP